MTVIAQAGARMLANSRLASLAAKPILPLALTGVIAGVAGGLAEVIWIGLYSAATGTNGFDIARRVADTVFPGILQTAAAPSVGLAIHFSLSAALGFILAPPLTSAGVRRSSALMPICLSLLALIWCANFKFILPAINPTFLTLLPIWVTLASKLFFGAALAGVIGHRGVNAALSPSQECERSMLAVPT